MEVGVNALIYVNFMLTVYRTIHISVLSISSKEIVVYIFTCTFRLVGTGVFPAEVKVNTFILYSQPSAAL